jgi:hypothetical protein
MTDADEPKEWETYEQVTRQILEQVGVLLGLELERVEGKQKLVGKSGMEWTIDGKGVKTEDGAIVVIECRRYPDDRIKAEAMGAFAYRIKDLGAAGGYMVTPIGFQDGADKIAKYEGIHEIRLDADSTATDFTVEFLDKVVHGRSATLKLNLRISATASVRKAEPKDG